MYFAVCFYLLIMMFVIHTCQGSVDISFTVCLLVFSFVRLWISPHRIKLVASNFSQWFRGVQGWESTILGNFAPQKPKMGHPTGIKVQGGKMYHDRVPIKFVRHMDVGSARVNIRPKDGRTCSSMCYFQPQCCKNRHSPHAGQNVDKKYFSGSCVFGVPTGSFFLTLC